MSDESRDGQIRTMFAYAQRDAASLDYAVGFLADMVDAVVAAEREACAAILKAEAEQRDRGEAYGKEERNTHLVEASRAEAKALRHAEAAIRARGSVPR